MPGSFTYDLLSFLPVPERDRGANTLSRSSAYYKEGRKVNKQLIAQCFNHNKREGNQAETILNGRTDHLREGRREDRTGDI